MSIRLVEIRPVCAGFFGDRCAGLCGALPRTPPGGRAQPFLLDLLPSLLDAFPRLRRPVDILVACAGFFGDRCAGLCGALPRTPPRGRAQPFLLDLLPSLLDAFPRLRRTIIFLLTATLLLLAPPTHATPDTLESRWLNGTPHTLSWTYQEERIRLQPGETHRLPLPAGTPLRVEPLDGPVFPKDLSLSQEDGSGLALDMPWSSLEQGRLVAITDVEGTRLISITLSRQAPAPRSFRIATGTPALTAPPPLYREDIPLPAPPLTLLRQDPPSRHTVHRLEAAHPVEISIQGPLRLRVESRLLWPEDDAQELRHHHRLTITLDDNPQPPWDILTALDSGPTAVQEAPALSLGTLEVHYVEIPTGPHRLRLSSSEPTLLRLLARRDGDFLLPALNAMTSGSQEDPPHLRILPRLRPPPTPGSTPFPVEELLASAHALAHDPARPEGPLEAVSLLFQAVASAPSLTGEDVLLAARRIRNRRTHFADLLPVPLPPEGLFPAYFPQRELLDPQTPQWPHAFPLRHIPAALEMVPHGLFVPLAPGGDLVFPLPKRSQASDLRLVVERPAGAESLPLEILFDGDPPRRAHLAGRQRPEPDKALFRETIGSTALAMMDPDDPWTVTAQPAFAHFRPPAPSLRAATLVLPLPASVDKITLRSPPGSPPLRVALQVRRAHAPTLSEAHYRAEVAGMGGEERLWQAFSAGSPLPPALARHVFPLQRWIKAQRLRFTAGIIPPPPFFSNEEERRRQTARAGAAMAREDWPSALWASRRAIHATPPDHPQAAQAWAALLAGLQAMGEPILRERILRGLLIHAKNPHLTALARRELEGDDRRAGRSDRLPTLLAWEAEQAPSPSRFTALAQALADADQDRLAFLAALLPPAPDRDHALVARLALKQGWIRTFLEAVAHLPRAEGALWRGWEAWSRGDDPAARDFWGQAGPPGAAVLAALQQGLRLQYGEEDPAQAARWWSAHPGPSGWHSPPGLVPRFHSAHTYVSANDGLPLTMALSRPGSPLVLAVNGPARLRLELRPAQAPGQSQRLTGWAILSPQKGEQRRWALTDVLPADGLRPLRPDSPTPGMAQERELIIPFGPQQITLDSPTLPLLVRAWVRHADYPLAFPPQTAPPAGTIAEDAPAPLQRLEGLLWTVEEEASRRALALAEAETLFRTLPATPQTVSLMRRLRRFSEWEPVRTVSASAGMRWVAAPNWQPESPQGRALAALLPPGQGDARLLTGHDRLLLSFNLMAQKRILLALTLTAPPFTPLHPTTAHLTVDGNPPRPYTLTARQTVLRLPVMLEPGERTLAVGLIDPVAGQMVRVSLEEEDGTPIPWNVTRNHERLYHAATPEEPLVVQVEGPAVVRLDQWHPEGSLHRDVDVAAGWQTLTFPPPPGESSALFRIFRRQVLPQPGPRPLLADNTPPTLPAPQADPLHPPSLPAAAPPSLTAEASGPTWSLGLTREERRDADDEAGGSGKERFVELSLTRRTHDALNHQYDRWGLLLRHHDHGQPTLGASAERRDMDPQRGFNWRLGGNLLLQDVQGQGPQAAITLRGGLSRLDHLSHHLDNLADLSAFARMMSMDHNKDGKEVDQDIFTPYRHDHRAGMTLTDTLLLRPWLDTTLSLRGSVTLNENPLRPDNVALGTEWEQLLGDARLSLGYTRRRYLADDQRSTPLTRHGPTLSLSLDQWPGSGRDRLEWSLTLHREQSTGVNTGLLGLSWHFDDNRLGSFAPGDRPFSDLRIPAWPAPQEPAP